VLWRLLRVSLTGVLQFAIANASWIGLVRIVALFGAASVAGYTVAIRVLIFFILPAWGLSNAAATLVGQNLGARHPERAEQAVWRTGLYNMLFLATLGIVFFVWATPVVRLFVDDPEVVAIGGKALRTFACGNIAYAWVMVLLQAFNGAGDTVTPTIVNFFGFWVLEIPPVSYTHLPDALAGAARADGKGKSRGADVVRHIENAHRVVPVSYTHLDVYKRQMMESGGNLRSPGSPTLIRVEVVFSVYAGRRSGQARNVNFCGFPRSCSAGSCSPKKQMQK